MKPQFNHKFTCRVTTAQLARLQSRGLFKKRPDQGGNFLPTGRGFEAICREAYKLKSESPKSRYPKIIRRLAK